MAMPTDLEIARAAHLDPIGEVAARAGIDDEFLELYGRDVAKVSLDAIAANRDRPRAKYIVVTAITPTPLGEGKTTTAVGIAQGLAAIGKRSMLALRQPSMGPTFGIKGGAAGAGYSQVLPMEKLNLHLTGDFHAITAAHNLLAAMIDNHLHHGNALDIEPHSISWRRVVDINDRALRNVIVGLGSRIDGVPRQSGFDITAASEVGVILSLATSLHDLRERLGRIVIGYNRDKEPVTAENLHAAGSMAVILKDALKPNLLQTTENTPVLVHTGPFGNIATGNSSVVADMVGIGCADYLLTEAGFGSDMGAERFFNIKCRVSGLHPDAAVMVATVRALKVHSGRYTVKPGRPLPSGMLLDNPDDVWAGAPNLRRHIEIVRSFGVTPVVALNVFPTDHADEIDAVRQIAEECGAHFAASTHVVDGGAGAADLARAVVAACEEPARFRYTYRLEAPLADKIEAIATRVYGADGIDLSPAAARELAHFEDLGYGHFPVVMAKTHLSLSHDPALKGAPTGWRLPVREVRAAAGAGYVYTICGDMRTMPGLASHPAAERIDIDADGNTVGLF
ncbi:formate--tetrahydrofolate ligase [Acidipropionibacterium jensenii]|uniref:Formate--tetrahydrofolate ligase n=2 Tax=Acidipropionibacterium jensenii TaxID=1749 RepID=A0A448P020_9ACTN|nr:formate--tetrahydrofolate ligase [Acidipropionibacterium jensenii]MDN5978310.1 formate--tetrahydrofolate ligase [Acidipropionibacterium jensenii]MDN5995558.1 formate--tetrahydrofolate ligase [Acidipropionibacterium jensenii]MDN6425687.1 formate--tetrahydrofolate ligase [Acidipropionibacterium jensenii]MDN6442837.1 formate--tetrahydrofolate ligase [Acidipropionibacterium jensenii]MDN6591655.1 formate--tetrahydrofolate ligase [Acidipropionibacterium jensenii]